MTFLLQWLGLRGERPSVRLRPRREVVLDIGFEEAYRACLTEIERTLAANVYLSDPARGIAEAGFGLVRSERIRCTVTPGEDGRTRVSVEAIPPAGVEPPDRSHNVDALADALARNQP
ncbi:MAG: hypothetical protein ACLQPV_02035 [Vulcanimicrobiaceae bacterium]